MKNVIKTSLLLSLASGTALANEGMWQPHQLPEIKQELQQLGLKIPADNISKLTEFPMNAVISLGGCTASFVSPKGLVVTNHHCAYGSIQYNSTEKNNILKNGFLAKNYGEELPAAPGSRVFVTEDVINVTDKINAKLSDNMTGLERYKVIDAAEKELIANCEKEDGYRCQVSTFHNGLEYFLIKKLEIRDVRLVYNPAASIGKFGGDIDNWMWPRQTGDYSFYRAYVSKDGKPADFSKDNVPFEPKSFLKVSAKGINDDDFVMVVGYPGRTNRYRTADQVKNKFTWAYPTDKKMRGDIINIIKENSEPGSAERIKYESTLAGLANYEKNFGAMIDSYKKAGTQAKKEKFDASLTAWINQDADRKAKYASALTEMKRILEQDMKTQGRDKVVSFMYRYLPMFRASNSLLRYSHEQQKEDAKRDSGYQKRDEKRFVSGLKSINRRFDAQINQQIALYLLESYAKLPAEQRYNALDQYFHLEQGFKKEKVAKQLKDMYAATALKDESIRLGWMDKNVESFAKSQDPFIKLAVQLYPELKTNRKQSRELYGQWTKASAKYMEALIAYKRSLNQPVYADANSTLRVTYGQVKGYQPQDGLWATPFTTVEGLASKYTGEDPFGSPKKQLELIKNKQYGKYKSEQLGTVPVNYLSTVDTTGGNSGSPTLNGNAELVGLLFDGVIESIIGDWDYDPKFNRSIHCDTRYMLWVMKYIDGADNLLEEMEIVE
ncbi:S46 family peptidase [Algicola sagamiensis]|uniref:S46 family peptidase n=1 Tax=Algicola sagamiensis TaxID=163869 RepID=UPI0003613187|nr:S46 family peptidase [Algicola sagamiensis]